MEIIYSLSENKRNAFFSKTIKSTTKKTTGNVSEFLKKNFSKYGKFFYDGRIGIYNIYKTNPDKNGKYYVFSYVNNTLFKKKYGKNYL